MVSFMDDIELTRSQLDATTRNSSKKINQLQETLEERKAGMNALRYLPFENELGVCFEYPRTEMKVLVMQTTYSVSTLFMIDHCVVYSEYNGVLKRRNRLRGGNHRNADFHVF